jgi:hypothetical protein
VIARVLAALFIAALLSFLVYDAYALVSGDDPLGLTHGKEPDRCDEGPLFQPGC